MKGYKNFKLTGLDKGGQFTKKYLSSVKKIERVCGVRIKENNGFGK